MLQTVGITRKRVTVSYSTILEVTSFKAGGFDMICVLPGNWHGELNAFHLPFGSSIESLAEPRERQFYRIGFLEYVARIDS
jgi:hypothetical protein